MYYNIWCICILYKLVNLTAKNFNEVDRSCVALNVDVNSKWVWGFSSFQRALHYIDAMSCLGQQLTLLTALTKGRTNGVVWPKVFTKRAKLKLLSFTFSWELRFPLAVLPICNRLHICQGQLLIPFSHIFHKLVINIIKNNKLTMAQKVRTFVFGRLFLCCNNASLQNQIYFQDTLLRERVKECQRIMK